VLPTRLAQAPDVIEGVINVRGKLAPVVDLRARFALARRALSANDVFLLCDCDGRAMALHADGALDLLQIALPSIVPPRAVSGAALYASGMVGLADGLLLICDLPAFLNEAERLALERALAAAQASELSA
jgi:purine-binding chemotaxis protein CheW